MNLTDLPRTTSQDSDGFKGCKCPDQPIHFGCKILRSQFLWPQRNNVKINWSRFHILDDFKYQHVRGFADLRQNFAYLNSHNNVLIRMRETRAVWLAYECLLNAIFSSVNADICRTPNYSPTRLTTQVHKLMSITIIGFDNHLCGRAKSVRTRSPCIYSIFEQGNICRLDFQRWLVMIATKSTT